MCAHETNSLQIPLLDAFRLFVRSAKNGKPRKTGVDDSLQALRQAAEVNEATFWPVFRFDAALWPADERGTDLPGVLELAGADGLPADKKTMCGRWFRAGHIVDGELIVQVTVSFEGASSSHEMHPTTIAYVCGKGCRVQLQPTRTEESAMLGQSGTITGLREDGFYEFRPDNMPNGYATVKVDPRPSNMFFEPVRRYERGQHLIMMGLPSNDGFVQPAWVDAEVSDHKFSNQHAVKMSTEAGGEAVVDLHDLNHVATGMTASEFGAAREEYRQHILGKTRFVHDHITDAKLDVTKEIVDLSLTVKSKPTDTAQKPGKNEKRGRPAAESAGGDSEEHGLPHMKSTVGAPVDSFRGSIRRVGSSIGSSMRRAESSIAMAAASRRPSFMKKKVASERKSLTGNDTLMLDSVVERESAPVSSVAGLVGKLTLKPDGRWNGRLQTERVLMIASSGSGKSWSIQRLCWSLAQNAASSMGTLPLVVSGKVLVELFEMDPESEKDLIEKYINSVHADKPQWRDMVWTRTLQIEPLSHVLAASLINSYRLRTLAILIDAMSEGGVAMMPRITSFFSERMVAHRSNLMISERPEHVDVSAFVQFYTVLEIHRLTYPQIMSAIEVRIKSTTYFQHLFAFLAIRKEFDLIYRKRFSDWQVRLAVEVLESPNLFESDTHPSGFDPELRCRMPNGQFVGVRNDGAPQSAYMKDLDARLRGQGTLEVLSNFVEELGTGGSIHEFREQIGQAIAAKIEQDDTTTGKIAVKLGLLWKKRQEAMGEGTRLTVVDLWQTIVSRTDDVYRALETQKSVFDEAVIATVKKVSMGSDHVKAAPLKDPVRLHEKAMDKFEERFDDDVPGEACVLDVIRSRVKAPDAKTLLKLMKLLVTPDGFTVSTKKGDVHLQIHRMKNKFMGLELDPTHFRNFLVILKMTHRDRPSYVELQIHHKDLAHYGEISRAHDHYRFFRAIYGTHYQHNFMKVLDTTLSFVEEVCTIPIIMSMLILVMDGVREGDEQSLLPTCTTELYRRAILKRLKRGFQDEAMSHTVFHTLLKLATSNHLAGGKRNFSSEDAAKTLEGHPEESECWRKLLDRQEIPLVKTSQSEIGKAVTYQFTHLSIQEALFVMAVIDSDTEIRAFWKDSECAAGRMNSVICQNIFFIGRGTLGEYLAQAQPEWDFHGRLNALGVASLSDTLQGVKSCTVLRVGKADLKDGIVEAIAKMLERNTQLKELHMNSIKLDDADLSETNCGRLFRALMENTNLEVLSLRSDSWGASSKASMTAASIRTLHKSLRRNTSITKLDLYRNALDDDALDILSRTVKENKGIQRLNLSYNPLNQATLKNFAAAMTANPSLTHVDFSGCKLGPASAKILAARLETQGRIVSLVINNNEIADAGGKALGLMLESNTTLENLEMERCRLGKESSKALIDAIQKNSTLKALNIANNPKFSAAVAANIIEKGEKKGLAVKWIERGASQKNL